MEKPDSASRLDEFAEALRRRIRVAGRAKVITHPRGRLGGPAATMSPRRPAPAVRRPEADAATTIATGVAHQLSRRPVRLIAIGASTGGPQALSQLLAELPFGLEAAVVVVQHMADGFIEGLASWLDGLCSLPVSVGSSGRRLLPGTVTVAPSGLNLVVHDQLRVTTHEPPATQFHVPGIDATFASVADSVGAAGVGVLLTGMGRDGALGLKRMRDVGAFTIAQDEETSVVYGMPAAAMALGAVELQLPLAEVGGALRRLTSDRVAT
jgi:two-component system chemotaxis response regulator CheB